MFPDVGEVVCSSVQLIIQRDEVEALQSSTGDFHSNHEKVTWLVIRDTKFKPQWHITMPH